jgi:methionyl-tRNA synthetase
MRPVFPKRAVVTAGMPYGNKELHFGHIGGVFVHADTYARFLRDRIGEENVIFVSGTDCYGSPILESYRKLKKDDSFTIQDYVRSNHIKQKEALDNYEISLNLFGASALDQAADVHNEVSATIFKKLYKKDVLKKLTSSQFYDPKFKVLLNGRQVVGKCPIQGCSSDKAYADECSLGHQYMPCDLIDPISTLSGLKPDVTRVANWYFDLEAYLDLLKERNDYLRENTNHRKYLLNTIEEFLKKPCIYVKKEYAEVVASLQAQLPPYEIAEESNKSSITLVFRALSDRETAQEFLSIHGVQYRTGKTLVPFRLTGNIEWGVPVPQVDSDDTPLTFWVWPESLWAPISFTKTYLMQQGASKDAWKEWWNSKDSKVYQFIGEDNIYFYGIAEMGLFLALQDDASTITPSEGQLQLPHLIPNNHILFLDKKASSSSDIKPPMAKDLLSYYTKEQLRIHFLSLGLSNKSVSFQPKPYIPNVDPKAADTVLKEGNLLTNVFNRLVRSCFYTVQKYYDRKIPEGSIRSSVLEEGKNTILDFELSMYNHEFHSLTYLLDTYIRNANKYWVNSMKKAESTDDNELRKQVLIDSFHAVRVTMTLLHSIAPTGCEMIRTYLHADKKIWNWDYIFEPITFFVDTNVKLEYLEPKVDFFKKHESQF